ncbi:YbfB/YjiJ family MFS transporter [Noviherbaspirillum pedocola]|uniref:YbfB/YjiJ family MFS transporter n=1 Tax=Noviherbaspirillum pedocola TaxID=2801341 RepID=A0A934T0P9_9BURK|nr:YbfB/YjiJ family MFS transporter [Noviherbaspirillum pedocola]MBK4738561.1 YbfB/YjiJ family MFS transporter [Noviherbaspirillum pedocola]
MHDATPRALRAWLPLALAGWCATLAGIGIGRFSYVPLLPLMIDAGWTSPAGAAGLAAANLLGYLAGALAAHPLALRIGATRAIRFSLLVLPLSFLACALQPAFAWMWFSRLAAGVAGGMLMIIAAPYVLTRVPAALRGKAVGIVFAGIGVGIIAAGLGVPAAGAVHLRAAWLALAACGFLALAYAWPKFAGDDIHVAAEAGPLLPRGPMLALACAYALDAIGYLPHAVFWVEYLVHGIGLPMSIGGVSWAVFGVGATLGPLIAGYAADRFGFRLALVGSLAVKAAAVALPLASSSVPALLLSAFLVGALTPGLVAVTSGRVVEIAGAAAHRRNWAMLTFLWALLQAAGGYAMTALYAALHSFSLLFVIGAAALSLAAVIAAGATNAKPLR